MIKRRWPELTQAQRDEYFSAWKFTYFRGLGDSFNIMAANPTLETVAITMVWMKAVLMDEEVIKVPLVISEARVILEKFIDWENSELGKYVRRLDTAIARERLNGQTRKVLKKIVSWVEKEDKKAAEMFLRATGQYDGMQDPGKGLPVTLIDEYVAGETQLAPQAAFYVQKLSPQAEAKLAVTAKYRVGMGGKEGRDIHTDIKKESLPQSGNGGVDWRKVDANLSEAQKLERPE